MRPLPTITDRQLEEIVQCGCAKKAQRKAMASELLVLRKLLVLRSKRISDAEPADSQQLRHPQGTSTG